MSNIGAGDGNNKTTTCVYYRLLNIHRIFINEHISQLPGATRGNCSKDIVVQLLVNVFFL